VDMFIGSVDHGVRGGAGVARVHAVRASLHGMQLTEMPLFIFSLDS
jgi:hypothetical protein